MRVSSESESPSDEASAFFSWADACHGFLESFGESVAVYSEVVCFWSSDGLGGGVVKVDA